MVGTARTYHRDMSASAGVPFPPFELANRVLSLEGRGDPFAAYEQGALTVDDLETPEDDPREYLALRHNLRQVQRELESIESAVRKEYEGSLSWRITRPLREGARLARSLRPRRSG